jgi:hypothetical protein
LRKILRRAAVLAAAPVALVTLSVAPAEAMQSVGLVEVSAGGSGGSVTGDCTWTATLPSIGGVADTTTTALVSPTTAESTDANLVPPIYPIAELELLDYSAAVTTPGGDIDRIWIAFSGKARATSSKGGAVAVTTSVRCYLRNYAWGSAGITAPGPSASITGEGEVYRLAPDPEICVVVSAAFSDGYTVPSTTRCHNL